MKALDEKRIGLLIRMNFIRACVCRKDVQMPLIRRGFVEQVRPSTYELTPRGKREAKRLMKQYVGKHIETYSGISIGGHVMIVLTWPMGQEPSVFNCAVCRAKTDIHFRGSLHV